MIRRSEMRMLAVTLMIITIVGIAAFQGYWIRKLYAEEWSTLKREADVAFRDVVYQIQLQRFRKDSGLFQIKNIDIKGVPDNLFMFHVLDSFRTVLQDSTRPDAVPHLPGRSGKAVSITLRTDIRHDTFRSEFPTPLPQDAGANQQFIIRYLSNKDSAGPPLSTGEIDSAYRQALLKAGITVPYRLERISGKRADLDKPIPTDALQTGFIFIGLSNAFAYQAIFSNPFSYIIGKLRLPIIVGILLLAFTTLSLIFLYRNLVQQQQIAAIKNEFISNMTHELKTPISTITVAVEALRHFGALDDRGKTREYLDISALELQRLSLLVDKVLKLSLFENKQIELKPERIDVPALTAEVMASMKLPFEKAGAVMQLNCEGNDLFVRGDRMHLASVISNLLDNALKYSRESPALAIGVSRSGDIIRIEVTDNGIGIPAAYREKIFEKFFRVPSGDVHNIKGYGLGLSYVHHIVLRHEGVISVESKEGKGSTFTIQLPAA